MDLNPELLYTMYCIEDKISVNLSVIHLVQIYNNINYILMNLKYKALVFTAIIFPLYCLACYNELPVTRVDNSII